MDHAVHVYPDTRTTLIAAVSRIVGAARSAFPGSALHHAVERSLFVSRSLACFPVASTWYAWLDTPLMAAVTRTNTSLFRKIIRPYLTPQWSNVQKLATLRSHYQFLSTRLTRAAFLDVCTRNGVLLLRFAAADGTVIQLRCVTDGKYRKEGEQSLMVYSERHGVTVSTLTFVLDQQADGPWIMIIGGTQGLPRGTDKRVITEINKSLHGLRPRALLLFVAQQLATAWRLDAIRAVSDAVHVSRHGDYALNRARRPRLDYDAFWQESGGVLSSDGIYNLPARHVARRLSDIKANKRSLYRHRYAMLDQLAVVLQLGLTRVGMAESTERDLQPPSRILAER